MVTLRGQNSAQHETRSRWKPLHLAIGALVTATALSFSGTRGFAVVAPATSTPTPAVASYFFDAALWSQMAAPGANVQMALVNVDSGPGSQPYAYVQTAVDIAAGGNVPLAGYVATNYGNRDLQAVLADIEKYRTFYGLQSIFLDETPYLCDTVPYYQSIYDDVKGAGGTVILNPGMNPYECFANVSDVIVNFEGTSSSYASWSPAAWTADYPANRFWHIIYNSGDAQAESDLALAATRNAGWVYITDKTLPNPWDALPSPGVWQTLTAGPSVESPTTTSPATSTTTTVTTPPTTTPPTTTPPTTTPPTTTPPTTTPATTPAPSTTAPTVPPSTTTIPGGRRSAPSAASAIEITQRQQAPSASPLVQAGIQPLFVDGQLNGAVIQLFVDAATNPPGASGPSRPAQFVDGVMVLNPDPMMGR